MLRNRVFYVIQVLILLVFSVLYKSRISSVLLIAALCYPLFAALTALLAAYTADAGFVKQREVHQKSENFELWIYVRSRFVFPLSPVEVQCSLPDRHTGIFAPRKIYAAVPPFGQCRIQASAMHRFRGSYTAQLNRIAVYDPLRIIRISRKIKREESLVFLPRRIELNEFLSDAMSESSLSPSPLLKGEHEDFSHVREYISGDMMQLVHWKLTAKLEELMTKQYDEATEHRTAILCDYSFDKSRPGSVMKQADAVIEAAVAFALSSIRAGTSVTVDFGSSLPGFKNVLLDMQDFERFYELMSVIPLEIETNGISSFAESARSTGASTILIITCNLTEEAIIAAQTAAEAVQGEVALIWLSLGLKSELETQAEGKKFLFVPVSGEIDAMK